MSDLVVRQLTEGDLVDADRINRVAFGTFFGLEDPTAFRGDGEVIPGRFASNPHGAFAAEMNGELVACGFVMDWGRVGLLGPLTVDVDQWGRGIGRSMMDAMTGYMDSRGFTLQGLFTHPQSPTHIRLYESYGFRMNRITAVMAKDVAAAAELPGTARLFSELAEEDRRVAIAECRNIAETVYPGLDLAGEITSIALNGFGDTVLLGAAGDLSGFACCHQGAGSEAGSRQTLVKFASVRSGPDAPATFEKLMAACGGFAAQRGTKRLVAGTNTGRAACYQAMLDMGFRSWMNGIAMLKPVPTADTEGYNIDSVFAVDDWR